MVTDALLVFLGGAVVAVIGLVPEWQPPSDPFGHVGYSVGSMAGTLDAYLPVTVILACLVWLVALKVFLLGWRLVVFIYHQVWGSD